MRTRDVSIDRVTVGSFWVNEKKGLVREITDRRLDGNVQWRSYFLEDGRPTGDSLMCSISQIFTWSDREATAEESARMQREAGKLLEFARAQRLIDAVLSSISDEQLLDEVRRRGYRVSGGGKHDRRREPPDGRSP